ncbi:hypothetical protein QTL95_24565 [Rhizobium sp. S152]|uniref:Pepco domain-containing protein n=1 Tax=Rhizobium sp. S152 TaxID=3055038 RepID=UPI0025A9F952|nr:hypothetical protein [Rhizobium sp. S152]MDM9629067.1 hypothetical protein [Rhizobium sp. S152]
MTKEIYVITSSSHLNADARSGDDIGGGFGSGVISAGSRMVKVSGDTLREQFANLAEVVEYAFDRAAPAVHLEQIELSVEITAEGRVGLLGSGTSVGGTGAIKLTFKRNVADAGSKPVG